jgi:hypothetical protein
VPHRLAHVESIHEAGGEFLAAGQVGPQGRPGSFHHAVAETFDPNIFRRPGALAIRVPAHLPLVAIVTQRLASQIDGPPLLRGALEPIGQAKHLTIGEPRLVDP